MNTNYCVNGFKSTVSTRNQVEMLPQNSSKPDFPEYKLLSERIKSFTDNGWPKHLEQTPLEMSMAGFFYTGKEDRVICFNCGGGLMKWEKRDDPFKHHAIWYNHCTYIQAIRPISEKESQQGLLNIQKNNMTKPKNKRKRQAQTNNISDQTIDKKLKVKFEVMDMEM